ncbi:hypothetical protein ACO0LG_08625 [Undibacterium sp. Ji42W]|uniref:hypothetical protein n=1 Tax=Undibacterium sp. Ji42W TaxID=3413039 RepID=UPI003BF2FD48
MKKFSKSIVLAAILAATAVSQAAVYQVGSVTSGTSVYGVDPFGPTVAKIQRPAGTADAAIKFTDGSTTTLSNGWSIISGSQKVFQSYDGAQATGTSATAGLDAGYDAVAFVKNNITYQTGVPGTKCATYFFLGGTSGTLCQTNYLDWIWTRTTP